MEIKGSEPTDHSRRVTSAGRVHSATRERVLRMIEAQSEPVSIAGLAAATSLHENTLRGHLEQLLVDGYVLRERERSVGRGRPAWLWRAARSTAPESTYAGLVAALASTLARTSDDPVRAARDAGEEWGAEMVGRFGAEGDEDAGTSGRETVVEIMREHGFSPDDTGDEVLLRSCPLIEAATRHPEIVCAVHQGMADAIIAGRGETGRTELQPFSSPGVCTLRFRPASSAALRREDQAGA